MEKIWSSKIIRADQGDSDTVHPLEMKDLSSHLRAVSNAGNRSYATTSSAAPDPDITIAQSELKKIREEAFNDGLLTGKEEGEAMAMSQVDGVIGRFLESVRELDRFRAELLRETEANVVDLIIAAARKIVKKEITSDRETIARVAKNALTCLTDRNDITVRVNPDDYTIIEQNKAQFFGQIDDLKNITFQVDDSIGEGGCLVESRFGEIDARIEKQLELLEEGMKSALSLDPKSSSLKIESQGE